LIKYSFRLDWPPESLGRTFSTHEETAIEDLTASRNAIAQQMIALP
jgi:hypothetical protein